MSDGENNRSLIIDTNALVFQLAYWIKMRVGGKERRLSDYRLQKAHDIISKYNNKIITPTIKSEFFENNEIKPKFF
jgi:hypothetical protein